MRRALLAGVAALALAAAFPRPAAAQLSETVLLTQIARSIIQHGTQMSNYIKAAFAGYQRTTDASNMANARFARDMRNAEIRDDHVATPAACENLDESMAGMVGLDQAWMVTHSLSLVTDPRGEAEPGNAAFVWQSNALAANRNAHTNYYCSQAEADAGFCAASDLPNADQRAWYFIGRYSYPETNGNRELDAAMAYATTVTDPLPLSQLRQAELRSMQGQDILAVRRWQNGLKSYARWVTNERVGRRVPVVVLTDAQRAQMEAQGLRPTDRGSWHLVMQLAVERRAGTAYQAALQRMPSGARSIETSNTLGLIAGIAWEQYKAAEHTNNLLAMLVAAKAEEGPEGRFRRAINIVNGKPEIQVQ